MLLQKEELEQKHVHLLQVVESEKTAKWQYTQQCEELATEIRKLRAEVKYIFQRPCGLVDRKNFLFRFVCCGKKRRGHHSQPHQVVEGVSVRPQLQLPQNKIPRTLHSMTSLTFRNCASQPKIQLSCGKLKKFRVFFAVGFVDVDGSRLSKSTSNHRMLRA
jgi:ABC-type phosphate/phosphonate transport system ATPase subunit